VLRDTNPLIIRRIMRMFSARSLKRSRLSLVVPFVVIMSAENEAAPGNEGRESPPLEGGGKSAPRSPIHPTRYQYYPRP
jgi:hypothetical protein